jgi:hypothetical protein
MPDPKDQLITALRATPAGIAEFLQTPLPEPPACSLPSDVDAAIIANGICAYFVLEMFRAFAGLTPVEVLLRIGQHNSVMETMTLAGLEYLADSSAEAYQVTIQAPTAGGTYWPGLLRIHAAGVNGTPSAMYAVIGAGEPMTLTDPDNDGVFTGGQYCEAGEHTLTVTGLFPGDTSVTATVTITVTADEAEEPAPPGGTDAPAIAQIEAKVTDTAQTLVDTIQTQDVAAIQPALDDLSATLTDTGRAVTFTGGQGGASGGGGASGSWEADAQAELDAASALLPTLEDPGVAEEMTLHVGKAQSILQKMLTFLRDKL